MESIISEFKRVLSENKECPEESISVYEVILRHQEKGKEFYYKKNEIIDIMKEYYQSCNSCPGLFFNSMDVSATFNYDKNTMILDIYEISYNHKYKVYLTKKNNNLFLKNDFLYQADDFYKTYKPLLSNLYDLYIEYESFNQDMVGNFLIGTRIKNTELFFGLNTYGWNIRSSYPYEMVASKIDMDGLDFIGIKSKKWLEQEKKYIKENINNVFDNIYIETSELPRYMQEEIRQEQAEKEQQRIIEEQMLQEALKEQEEKIKRKEERRVKFKSFISRFKKRD